MSPRRSRERLRQLGAPDSKISVLRNGVDLKLFAPGDRAVLRGELNLRGPLLLSVGHLMMDKGHQLVIEALPHLPAMHLAIVGDGPMRARLQALAAELGVADRVTLDGQRRPADAREVLRRGRCDRARVERRRHAERIARKHGVRHTGRVRRRRRRARSRGCA